MASIVQAVRMALHVGETQLGVTDVFGQDVGPPLGGVFTATQGLETAWSTPLDERGIVGTAIGLALAGQKPVAEIQFCDYAFNTIDLLKIAGNTHWSCAGDWNVPLVLMTPVGAGIHGSIYHSHSFDSQATRTPGWKIFMPSNPRDAYGMLLAAIADPNPVMVLLPKALMRSRARDDSEMIPGEPKDAKELSALIDAPVGDRTHWKPTWPDTAVEMVPFAEARVVHEGSDLTAVSYGRGLILCRQAAEQLAAEGVDVEVIDLRCLQPYDWATLEASIAKTGRALFVNEDTEVTNFGEHLMRRTVETLFDQLTAAPALHAGVNLPGVGLADTLENASVPTASSVKDAMMKLAAAPARNVLRPKGPTPQAVPIPASMLDPAQFDFADVWSTAYRVR